MKAVGRVVNDDKPRLFQLWEKLTGEDLLVVKKKVA